MLIAQSNEHAHGVAAATRSRKGSERHAETQGLPALRGRRRRVERLARRLPPVPAVRMVQGHVRRPGSGASAKRAVRRPRRDDDSPKGELTAPADRPKPPKPKPPPPRAQAGGRGFLVCSRLSRQHMRKLRKSHFQRHPAKTKHESQQRHLRENGDSEFPSLYGLISALQQMPEYRGTRGLQGFRFLTSSFWRRSEWLGDVGTANQISHPKSGMNSSRRVPSPFMGL